MTSQKSSQPFLLQLQKEKQEIEYIDSNTQFYNMFTGEEITQETTPMSGAIYRSETLYDLWKRLHEGKYRVHFSFDGGMELTCVVRRQKMARSKDKLFRGDISDGKGIREKLHSMVSENSVFHLHKKGELDVTEIKQRGRDKLVNHIVDNLSLMSKWYAIHDNQNTIHVLISPHHDHIRIARSKRDMFFVWDEHVTPSEYLLELSENERYNERIDPEVD